MSTTSRSELVAHRLITLDTAHNVRHIGGYATGDGKQTRPDVVRAASLHRLTDAGLDSLVAAGIGVVVDLRSQAERDQVVTPDLAGRGIKHVHAPVFQADAPSAANADDFPGFQAMYRDFLRTGIEAYRTLFEELALSHNGFLYHCAIGKDRTGVATMLLLELAGVSDEDILEDYSHSSELLALVYEQWEASLVRDGKPVEPARLRQTSDAADIADTLGHVRAEWGGAAGYMASIGIDGEVVAMLRRRLVTAP